MSTATHQATFEVERPDRPLNRLTTALRAFTVIPAAILLASLSGGGLFAGLGNGGLWIARRPGPAVRAAAADARVR
jgi:hypothetical protein